MKILGYSDKISVFKGETIRFHVSCDGPKHFRSDIVRVICGDENPRGPGYKEELISSEANGFYPAKKQETHAGSYGIIRSVASVVSLSSFTVQAMIWPTTPKKGKQVILGLGTTGEQNSFQLMIDDVGALALCVADESGLPEVVSTGVPLDSRAWYFVSGSYDASAGRLRVMQEPLICHAFAKNAVRAERQLNLSIGSFSSAPIMLAACIIDAKGRRLITDSHYNGKIDGPHLAKGALDFHEMREVWNARPSFGSNALTVGAWDFSLDIESQKLTDISGNQLHGETVNLPTRAMTGHNWKRRNMCWTQVPEEYGAIHFHDDDLYDAGWETAFKLTIPETMKSGCYAARLRADGDEDYVPFYVRPSLGCPTSKIAYLASTASYMAYGNYLFVFDFPTVELLTNRVLTIYPWEQYLKGHPELAGSMYECHSDGSGICYSSRLRPLINQRPKAQLSLAASGSELWGYNADTHLTDWLEARGFDFDVITDEDLESEGAQLLDPYRVVLTGTHPEYSTVAMWDAIQEYTKSGGRLMYMGGNGFYWHIAYHQKLPGVIEVRRTDGSTRAWSADFGESYHSFTGQFGGLLRQQGRTPNMLTGAGFTAQGFDFSVGFRRTEESLDPRVSWAFEGIGFDEVIGDFGLIGSGAAGLEVDCAERSLGTPKHALVVARADSLSDTFMLVPEQSLVPMPNQMGTMHDQIRADLVFHETDNGGAVFAFSSIAWCGSLAHNNYRNNVSHLTENVLHRFVSKALF